MNTLESIAAVPNRFILVEKVPSGAKWIGPGKHIAVPSPVDFCGTIKGSGRSIFFDAKMSDKPLAVDLRVQCFAEHQRLMLLRHGEAGAVSGLLLYNRKADALYWLDWRYLHPRIERCRWDDVRLIAMGNSLRGIDWSKVLTFH